MSCEETGCARPRYARGRCERHYRQLLRRGAVLPERVAAACSVEGCERPAEARGWCHGHYLRWRRSGDVRPDVPLRRPLPARCSVGGCDRPMASRGLCGTHLWRLRRHDSARPEMPVRSASGDGGLSHGYVKRPVPHDERWLVRGATSALEHRLVMARLLGRPLRADESVHHRNGDRTDNRPDNLELWTRYQPNGSRVVDKLAWAFELIRRYEPEVSSALGFDLDPETGLPWDEERPDHFA